MLKEALQYLVGLAKPHQVDHNGRTFLLEDDSYQAVTEPWPNPLGVTTLTALVDILHSNRDGLNLGELYALVEEPAKVCIYRKISGPENQRTKLYVAQAELPALTFGQYMDLEEFRIMLMAGFVLTDELTDILSIAANYKEDSEAAVIDTGITQRVTVKTGVSDMASVNLKPMYKLQPFRTFQEVEQPAGNFIFRLRKGGQAALFAADAGAWRYDARERVGNWLRGALAGDPHRLAPDNMKDIPVLV